METVSTFTLNPLATCFIPSSMKYQSMSPTIFSVPSYETSVYEYTETKYGQFPVTTIEQNIGYLKVMKAQSNSTWTNMLVDPFVTIKEVKETRYDTVKKDEVVKEPLITKPIVSTMNEMSGKEPPVKSDDEKTSERNCKDPKDMEIIDSKDMEIIDSKDMEIIDSKDMEIIDSKDKILAKLDLSLTNKTIISKIMDLLKGGTKALKMLLPFAVRSMLIMELFYRMGLRTISLNVTMTSHMCSVFKPNSNAITFPNKTKKAKIAKKRKSYEYRCPPMFGWITPFQAFGNPLTLSETCNNDYVHTSFVDGDFKLNQYEHSEPNESSMVNDGETTLEQCSLELKAVIKDVCDSISSHDEDNDSVPKTRKRPVWETKSAKEIRHLALGIIDDGTHPLLEENHEVDTEDTEIPKIQAFLERAFSFHKNSTVEVLPSQSVCNPPCSVWCNKVPPPAKDAYKRFIRNRDSESTACNKATDVKVLKKTFYKRCFSADDTPKYYDKMLFQSASSMESKERLLLLHKDPVSFIKQSRVSALKDINHQSRSTLFVFDQAAIKGNSTESSSDKWSLYDGADSKWQPLPDCIPSTDSTQKQAHRKARDIRRQKSVC